MRRNVQITQAEDAGTARVGYAVRRNVQALACGNHGGFHGLCPLGQGVHVNAHAPTIDAPGVTLLQRVGMNLGDALAVNQAAVADHRVRPDVGVLRTDLARSAVAQAQRLDLHPLLGGHHAAVGEPAIGVQHQLVAVSPQRARVAYAKARFGAHDKDLARINAAQMRYVQGEFGRCIRVRPGILLHNRLHQQGYRVLGVDGLRILQRWVVAPVLWVLHLVAPSNQAQMARPQGRVDARGARQNGAVVGRAHIQPQFFDADYAARDPVVVYGTTLHLHRAGAQGDAAGVEKAPAVDHNAGRVGNDDFGPRTGHLDKAP